MLGLIWVLCGFYLGFNWGRFGFYFWIYVDFYFLLAPIWILFGVLVGFDLRYCLASIWDLFGSDVCFTLDSMLGSMLVFCLVLCWFYLGFRVGCIGFYVC